MGVSSATTTICVPVSLKIELDNLKLIPREAYYNVIQRLIEYYTMDNE